MTDRAPRTALVTGATSGIGHATAVALRQRGYRVLGTSRNPDAVLADARIDGVELLALDLEDPQSVERLAADVGPVDVLVNNAGESQVGALEDLPADAVRRLFELNVLAPVRLTQLLVGDMRKRGYGRVVMVGSMQATFPMAFRSSYGASKAAIRAFADGARGELSPFGVWVTTVEPGAIKTGISARRSRYLPDGSPYAGPAGTIAEAIDARERDGVAPEKVAALIVKAVEADPPRSLYAIGSGAPYVFAAQRVLPRDAMLRIVGQQNGLSLR